MHVLWVVLSNPDVKVITHRRSLRTRRTRHSGLARSALQDRRNRDGDWESWPGLNLLISSVITAGYSLPLFQEYQVCHLFHQYLVNPKKREKRKRKENEGRHWLHLAHFPDHRLFVCVHSHSLLFCQLLPVGPGYLCYPEEKTVRKFAMHIRTTVPVAELRNISSFFFLHRCFCQ